MRSLIVVALVLLAVVAAPSVLDLPITTPAGGAYATPSPAHALGTDILGRDVLARVVAGGRPVVLQALAATLLGSAIGAVVAIWSAATTRRRAASVAAIVVDAAAALPAVLVLLILAAGVPGSEAAVAIAIAIVSLPFSVRVLRAQAAHVLAAPAARDAAARGDRLRDRLVHDVLPGMRSTMLAEAGIRFVAAAQLAATAGFLGLGAGAPAASWGRMVRENLPGIALNPVAVLAPAVLLVLLGVAIVIALDRSALPARAVLGHEARA